MSLCPEILQHVFPENSNIFLENCVCIIVTLGNYNIDMLQYLM